MPCGNLQLRRYQEIILLVVIIAVVCLLSSLPLVIYFVSSTIKQHFSARVLVIYANYESQAAVVSHKYYYRAIYVCNACNV